MDVPLSFVQQATLYKSHESMRFYKVTLMHNSPCRKARGIITEEHIPDEEKHSVRLWRAWLQAVIGYCCNRQRQLPIFCCCCCYNQRINKRYTSKNDIKSLKSLLRELHLQYIRNFYSTNPTCCFQYTFIFQIQTFTIQFLFSLKLGVNCIALNSPYISFFHVPLIFISKIYALSFKLYYAASASPASNSISNRHTVAA